MENMGKQEKSSRKIGTQYELNLSNKELMDKLNIDENEFTLLSTDYLFIKYKFEKDMNNNDILSINKVEVVYGVLVDKIINNEVIVPNVTPIIFKLFGNKDSEVPYIYMYDKGVYNRVSVRYIRNYIRQCFPTLIYKSAYADEIIKQIMDRNELFYDISLLDNEMFEHYICFNDGLLNTQTWELEPHTANVMLTSKFNIDCPYGREVYQKGVFNKYLNDLCTYYKDDVSYVDEDVKKLILEAMGLVFSNYPGYLTKSCILMKGAKDTGKTQIKNLISKIIGEDKISSVELKALNESRFVGSEIYGKRLIGSNDLHYSTTDDMGMFKSLTGNDNIVIEFKNKDSFNYKFKGFIWFLSNEYPPISGNKGNEIYERFMLIPCDNPIPKEKQDSRLLDKMLKEKEYIIALALNNLKDLMDRDFKFIPSDRMLEAIKQYEASNNTLLQFINECCIINNDLKGNEKVKRSDFKTYYKRWCNISGIRNAMALKKSTFDYLEKTFETTIDVYNGNKCLSNIKMNMEEDAWQVNIGA